MVPPRWKVTSELNDPSGALVAQSRSVTRTNQAPRRPLPESDSSDCACAAPELTSAAVESKIPAMAAFLPSDLRTLMFMVILLLSAAPG